MWPTETAVSSALPDTRVYTADSWRHKSPPLHNADTLLTLTSEAVETLVEVDLCLDVIAVVGRTRKRRRGRRQFYFQACVKLFRNVVGNRMDFSVLYVKGELLQYENVQEGII